MVHRVVVLGAGYAGLVAALRLSRQVRPEEVSVTLVTASPEFCERPRLHQMAAGQQVRRYLIARYLERTPVRLRVGHVTCVDTTTSEVSITADVTADVTADEGVRRLGYDTLVYGLGSKVSTGGVRGVAEHAHRLDDPATAGRLRESMAGAGREGDRVVVCGAGMTGIEVATELAESYPARTVELVSRREPGAWLSARARAYLASVLADLGVHVRAGVDVEEVCADHVHLGDGRVARAGVTVWAGGFTVPPLAREAGLGVDASGRVLVDRTLRSRSHPDVYAVGDAAAVAGPWGEALAMGCRTGGFTGPAAADAIAARLTGRPPKEMRFRYIHECISLGRRRGVVQFLDRSGRPTNRALRGRAAIVYKNATLNGAQVLFRRPGPYVPRRRGQLLTTATTGLPASRARQ